MSKQQDTTYNGWKNRTTWNIMLWLDNNDEATYRYYVAEVRKRMDQGKRVTNAFARAIAINALGEVTPDGCKLTAKCVDWRAIADAMTDSAK